MNLLFLVIFMMNNSYSVESSYFGEVKYLLGSAARHSSSIFVGDKVFLGDVISTVKKSYIRIKLKNSQGAIQVGPNSQIKLEKEKRAITTINLLQGFILSTIKSGQSKNDQFKYQVKVKSAAMGVRGTTFFAQLNDKNEIFQCICEGKVESKWGLRNTLETLESKHHDLKRPLWEMNIVMWRLLSLKS